VAGICESTSGFEPNQRAEVIWWLIVPAERCQIIHHQRWVSPAACWYKGGLLLRYCWDQWPGTDLSLSGRYDGSKAQSRGSEHLYSSHSRTIILFFYPAALLIYNTIVQASPTTDGYELLAAASYTDEQPTALTIWCNQVLISDRPYLKTSDMASRFPTQVKRPKQGASDFSTFRVVILCALVSFLCHLVVSTMSLDRQMMASFVPISKGSSTSSSSTISQPAVPTTMGNLPSQPAIVASPVPSIIFL